MRPLETLLVLANGLTFVVITVPRLRAVRWMRHSAPITLVIGAVQVLGEGRRWQMIPAYALTGIVLLAWLVQNTARGADPPDRNDPSGGAVRTREKLATERTFWLRVPFYRE